VICAADERYALPLGVMLESLLASTPCGNLPALHIVDCGLSADSRERIEAVAHGRARLVWQPSRRFAQLSDPPWGHVSGATYERLLIEDYLPAKAARALWLDCDLLLLDDATPLLEMDPGGAVLCAVRDPLVPRVSAPFGVHDWRRLNLAPETPYFNAGVMLIDLDRWRAMEVARRSLDYLETYGRAVWFNEQEALNAVIGNGWARLDDRWNLSANPVHARRQHPSGDPAILHYAGRVKPWAVAGLGGIQDRYFRHLDNTPWRGIRPQRKPGSRLLAWYLGSNLRRMTYWLENQHMRLRHYWGF
jgi:lipopolysaccharide biosynthesis glycosyltransferase